MASSSPVPRSHSRNSFYSTTTYHSFQDVELYEPTSMSESRATGLGLPVKDAPIRRLRPSRKDDLNGRHPSSFQMMRQDSGYESSTPTPRSEHSSSRRQRASSSKHATSTSSSSSSSSSPPRPASQTRAARGAPKRPSLRRTTASGPISHLPARSSLTMPRAQTHPIQTQQQLQQQHTVQRKHSYFQFPAPDGLDEERRSQHSRPQSKSSQQQQQQQQRPSSRPSIDLGPVILTVNTANENSNRSPNPNELSGPSSSSSSSISNHHHHHHHHHHDATIVESPIVSPYAPPQTTHYWTSDRTRRLEYAAIDAASRGVRGWVMRNMVPDCFVPREKRRVGFDDDSGSVRRYRLDLEIECPEESVPPSPVGEKLRGFRARARAAERGRSWWSRLRGCT